MYFTRNLCGQVGASKRTLLATELAVPRLSADRSEADRGWLARGHPQLVVQLEEELEDCMSCLWFPLAHRARIRMTNGLERLSRELKRRTRLVRIFPNRESCLRLVTSLAAEHSDAWLSGRRYLKVRLPSDEHHAFPVAAE